MWQVWRTEQGEGVWESRAAKFFSRDNFKVVIKMEGGLAWKINRGRGKT